MEWLVHSKAPAFSNNEVGFRGDQSLAPEPLFSYLHLDSPLDGAALTAADFDVPAHDLRRFQRFNDPDIIAPLYDLAKDWIASQVDLDALLH